uniref:Uncharacterized protein n=1 Tax=Arundo donax TaxID=35708 RepID=A0A0A8ZZJ4_ARUDO
MSDPLHMHCFLALSVFSITLMGSLIEHMAYVGMEEMTELTSCNLPVYVKNMDDADRLLSILPMISVRSCTFSLVVPRGRPRYVKGSEPI